MRESGDFHVHVDDAYHVESDIDPHCYMKNSKGIGMMGGVK